jgi:uncharacterized protein
MVKAKHEPTTPHSGPDDRPGPHAFPPYTDFNMRIARDGTWFYHGTPIGRKPLVKLFSSVLRREADGSYWLVTPVERGRIEVEDAPFTAVELTRLGAGRAQELTFRTNLDEAVPLDSAHPLRIVPDDGRSGPQPYVLVRGALEARLLRPVFYDLVEQGEVRSGADGPEFGVWSRGEFFRLGSAEAFA